MRCLALASAMTVAMVSATWASEPSREVLGDMGLGGLVVMSDDEGLAVRGFGYSPVKASGVSWATVRGKGASAGSINKYSSTGKHKAWGESDSHAGIVIVKGSIGGDGGNDTYGNGGGHGGRIKVKAVIAFSGGSSHAGRK